MSRFYASSSSSESDSDSSSSDSDVQVVPKTKARQVSSSEDEVEVKRVVRSGKDKLFDQFEKSLTETRQQIQDSEWTKVQTGFEATIKLVEKSANLIQKEGIPPAFIKILFVIEHGLANMDTKKKLSPTNTKSVTILKQKIKKVISPTYEKQIKQYRDSPELAGIGAGKAKPAAAAPASDSESESESESESSEDEKPKKPVAAVPKKPAAAAAKKPPAGGFKKIGEDSDFSSSGDDDSEESDSEFDDDSDESDTSSSDYGNEDTYNKWIKKDAKKPAPATAVKPKDRVQRVKPVEAATGDASATPDGAAAPAVEQRPLTAEEIVKKLKDLHKNRGKKGTSPAKQIEELENLLSQVKNEKDTFDILYTLINSQFDLSPTLQTSLPIPVWKTTSQNILKLINILETDKNFVLLLDHEEVSYLKEGQIMVRGNLLSLYEKLDEEYVKSLQHMNNNYPSTDYTARLADEDVLLSIGTKVQQYLEDHRQFSSASRAAVRRLAHIYYRVNVEQEAANAAMLKNLSSFVYQYGDERLKARTILFNIYFSAIHNHFHAARDMMLMSHLQDNPTLMDVTTQILFNRSIVQVGLCAFRNGYIQEAQNCLAEYSGLRKELIAQGVSMVNKYQEKDQLKEIDEKQRILPAHMHIPFDLIETVNLLSGMLIAVPQNAARPFDNKFKTCKFYQRHMDHLDKQTFIPPAETFKDVIYAASKKLATGNWRSTIELISGLKLWTMIADADAVRERLNRIIQEVSLKTYLFTYSAYYSTMLLDELATRFDLPKNHVHSILSKMMANHEISASWEHSTETITFHRSEQTKLQYLALNYSDSLINFVEQNERIYDSKFGSYRNKKFDDVVGGGASGSGSHGHHQGGQHRDHHHYQRNKPQQHRGGRVRQ
ncbi:hypothetical protein SAMD00019534_003670 [Acytostelium subglobosum LB1]|uniref:hypothetical protein n=1 Tax=Acytostelium subglobosum LB1 TaxID=1410327 RepID=UPI0006450771|nr:hypothetical protein SAMD00019534_003670 [Acytostelium subglobosum LB1]GAM17192.1 hypothetical protein SAMD00019534_003670 [Acytostelium subglobosum LB1]|eukprot:XP_012759254.1 hypothetical protein SAMD00019534_003670 [Acytostelium subglobosum LB1]